MDTTYSATNCDTSNVTLESIMEAIAKIPPMPVCPALILPGKLVRERLTVEQRCHLRLFHYDHFGVDFYVTETHPLHPDHQMDFFMEPFLTGPL